MSTFNGWLLDTNVLSELRKTRPEEKFVHFVRTCPQDSLFISTVTAAEIRFGIDLVSEPGAGVQLNRWLEENIRRRFAKGTLPITEDILYRWRVLVEQGRKAGHTFSQPDLFLAATALEHNLVFVTRNVKDFTHIDLEVINPWKT